MNFPSPALSRLGEQEPLPTDLTANTLVANGCLIVMALTFGIGLCWFTWRAVRGRDPLPLLLLAGGVVGAFGFEALLDEVALCWHAINASPDAITAFGREIPLWVPLGYAWYFGAASYFLYLHMERNGVDVRQLFRVFLGMAVLDTLMEVPLVSAGVYRYFGDQPFSLFGFPLWFAVANAAAPVIAACVVFIAREHLRGRWAPAAVLIVPTAFGATYFCGNWPLILTLNMNVPTFVQWITAVISAGLTMLMFWIAISLAKNHSDNRTEPASGDSVLATAGPYQATGR